MEDKIKLLKYFTNASELVQATFFVGLVFLSSLVAYFQSYDPNADAARGMKGHLAAWLKTFVSGVLAFVFTLLLSATMNWDFFFTCIAGGVSVLFSKQFFEALYKFVIGRFGGDTSGLSTARVTDVAIIDKDQDATK